MDSPFILVQEFDGPGFFLAGGARGVLLLTVPELTIVRDLLSTKISEVEAGKTEPIINDHKETRRI